MLCKKQKRYLHNNIIKSYLYRWLKLILWEAFMAERVEEEVVETTSEVVDSSVVEVGSLVEDDVDENAEVVVVESEEVTEEEKSTAATKDEKKKLKAFRFDRTQAKEFMLDGQSLNVSIYKRVDVSFKTDNSVSLNDIAEDIERQIRHILSLVKAQDVVILDQKNHELHYGKSNLGCTVMVPYSERLSLTLTNIKRILDKMYQEYGKTVIFRMKTKDVAKIHYNQNVSSKFFFKGFVATSHSDGFETENGFKRDSENYIKSAAFIANDAGLSKEDVSVFNRYNLTLTRLGLFNEGQEAEGYDYYLPFRRKLSFITYGIGINDANKKYVKRNVINISLMMQDILQNTKKVVTGILLSKDSTEFEINKFQDVFKDNVLSEFTGFETESYENETFETEINMINENLIDAASEA